MCYNIIMDRLTNFTRLNDHPHYSRQMSRLSAADLEVCINFLVSTADMDNVQYAQACNSTLLSTGAYSLIDKVSPKKLTLVNELLFVARHSN